MTELPRRGLGRGLGSLIPTRPAADTDSPADGRGSPSSAAAGSWSTDEAGAAGAAGGTVAGVVGTDRQGGGDREGADGLRPVDGVRYAEIAVDSIRPNPRQPRQAFDDDAMAELVASVREVGLLQPVVVRAAADGGYELVMGERRWRAGLEAGLTLLPAIVRDAADDVLLRDALLENLHRADLNPLEEAAAYQQLLDDFGCTHDELASRLGRSRPQISNTLRLLKLTAPVQRRVAAGVLSAGHARTLLGVEDAAAQDHLAGRVVAEGISVRGLEELVAVGTAETAPARRERKPTRAEPVLTELAERLGELFDTRVKVDLGRSKGRITIEFASMEDLERIVAVMQPPESAG